MPTVTLTRDHLDHKAGDTLEVSEEQAHYFQCVGLAAKEKAEGDPHTKKKADAGPKKK